MFNIISAHHKLT